MQIIQRWLMPTLIILAVLTPVSLKAEPAKNKDWPFTKWSYAKIYTYNFFDMRPGTKNTIYKMGEWSPHILTEKRLDPIQASRIISAVNATKGSFVTASCFFPRHAAVFFDKADQPVGVLDICFQCEGQRAWPDFKVSIEVKYGLHASDTLKQSKQGLYKNFEDSLKTYTDILSALDMPIDHTKAQ